MPRPKAWVQIATGNLPLRLESIKFGGEGEMADYFKVK